MTSIYGVCSSNFVMNVISSCQCCPLIPKFSNIFNRFIMI